MQNWGQLELNQHAMIIDAESANNYLTKVNYTISNKTASVNRQEPVCVPLSKLYT